MNFMAPPKSYPKAKGVIGIERKNGQKCTSTKATKTSQELVTELPLSLVAEQQWELVKPIWDWNEEAPVDPAKELQVKVNVANAGWPWGGDCPANLVTQAPFSINEYRVDTGFFTKTECKQTAPFFNLHRGAEYPIFGLLFQYHGVISKFAATCQTAFHMVASYIDHWDISRADFNSCNKNPKLGGRDAAMGGTVVVSKFRNRRYRGDHFECEMYALNELTYACYNMASRFEILHLHRIPMLTTQLLSILVPHMRNLKTLGVYRCELIHIGHTMQLLEIIRTNRGSGMTSDINLDFYPRYHIGPADEDPKVCSGSYGVTWDNFTLDSRLAIWQILSVVLPQARKQGVDLISKDAAFRLWMERVPLWRLDDTIHAILHERDPHQVAAQVDFPHSRGRKSRLGWDGCWSGQSFSCRGCDAPVLGIFFHTEELRQRAYHTPGYIMECLGCMLSRHLDQEEDHYKIDRSKMVKAWLGSNTEDVAEILHPTNITRGRHLAIRYDVLRKSREASGAQWIQKAWSSSIRYSPTIYDVEPKVSQW
ncbi:MAG: hypothetical protein M1818_001979 [Claussenomyces sp. TS43310]|nr:MAG: hypothetical protein M1818_001979 [Claussenomyces sp. TS43310]